MTHTTGKTGLENNNANTSQEIPIDIFPQNNDYCAQIYTDVFV